MDRACCHHLDDCRGYSNVWDEKDVSQPQSEKEEDSGECGDEWGELLRSASHRQPSATAAYTSWRES